jgi:outer membrane protein TolC
VPDPTLFAQYESDRPDNPHTLGIGVAFPIPAWNRSRGAILAAESATAQARRDAEHVRAQASAELAAARSVLAAALDRRRLLHDELLPRAE